MTEEDADFGADGSRQEILRCTPLIASELRRDHSSACEASSEASYHLTIAKQMETC